MFNYCLIDTIFNVLVEVCNSFENSKQKQKQKKIALPLLSLHNISLDVDMANATKKIIQNLKDKLLT